jgi:hypothetical protein
MWKSDVPPTDQRVLVSAKGKTWIGIYRARWPNFDKPTWSIMGKTTSQIEGWRIDGWQPLPEAINAKPEPSRWKPVCYLDALELSKRSDTVLRAAGITDKKQIMELTEEDLRALPNAGSKTVKEILEWRHRPNKDWLAQIRA